MRPFCHVLNKYVALLLVFALFSLALPLSSVSAAPQVVGKLSTRGNLPVIVNGNNAEPGASILDGAVLETPDGTGATISLGSLGEIDLAPNTVAEIRYVPDQSVKVNLKRGCAIVRTKQGIAGSIETPDGTTTQANQDNGGKKQADVCFPLGATTPLVNTGAAGSAGAGASGGFGSASGASSSSSAVAAGGGTTAAVIAGIGAVVAGIIIGLTTDDEEAGGNISGSSPNRIL